MLKVYKTTDPPANCSLTTSNGTLRPNIALLRANKQTLGASIGDSVYAKQSIAHTK